MKKIVAAALFTALLASSPVSLQAAPCKDAKGKFIKCPPPPPPAPAKGPCKDAKGKFTKCPPAIAKKGPCKDAKGKFKKCT
jgi:hypothetical protein